ncbi:MAG: ABC transporter substrate-binding protein [Proteiniphilum sp.]|jgi:iron complex transport system substrate-binding protein|nr:ABC transporter substrate-binding protein [Proteiniphilum sp.]
MQKSITVFMVGMLITLAGCNGNQQERQTSGERVTITHALDTVEVPMNPQRVVVLDFSALENLDYLGIKPVGVPMSGLPAHLSKYSEDASITDVGSIVEVNLEKINALQPDLIIMGRRLVEFYEELTAIAPVIYPNVDGSDDFLGAFTTNLHDLGEIFGRQEQLNEALAAINKRIERVKAKVETSEGKALILLHNRGRFSAYGSGSRFGFIHDVLGVPEAAQGLGTHTHGNPVSSEYVQKVNPDILFIVDRSQVVGNLVLDREQVENQLVQQTNASRKGMIIYLNPEYWYLAGGGITSVNAMIDEVEQAL